MVGPWSAVAGPRLIASACDDAPTCIGAYRRSHPIDVDDLLGLPSTSRREIPIRREDGMTGEVLRGRIRGDREAVGEWVGQFAGEHVQGALQACTGWSFVYEVLAAAGRWRIWPSRCRRARCAARNVTPRPIAPTRAGCGRYWPRAGCRRRGPARARARADAAAQDAHRRAHVLAAADPGDAVLTTASSNVRDLLLRANGRAFLRTLALPPASLQRIEIALAIIDPDRPPTRAARARAPPPGAPVGRLSGPMRQ